LLSITTIITKNTNLETIFTDEYFMKKALQEAEIAFEKDEIPVGAVIVVNDTIIARTHNLTELLHDVTAHAEMQAITSAANFLGGKYLKGCTLYVTLEPCQMCAGALYWSQISKIVFGATDSKRGYKTLGTQIHPKTEVVTGILEKECSELMTNFFQKKR
jgi:tRNA(adenine34) deaminase